MSNYLVKAFRRTPLVNVFHSAPPVEETLDLHQLHLAAGRAAGREKTCGNKRAFGNDVMARTAANHHNNWKGRDHDVEPYPCAFCGKYHIGRVIPIEVLKSLARKGEIDV